MLNVLSAPACLQFLKGSASGGAEEVQAQGNPLGSGDLRLPGTLVLQKPLRCCLCFLKLPGLAASAWLAVRKGCWGQSPMVIAKALEERLDWEDERHRPPNPTPSLPA